MTNLFSDHPSIPLLRPMVNLGGLFDIPVGSYFSGANGESILNGGLCPIFVIAGPKHTFKTTLLAYIIAQALNRIDSSLVSINDTENTLYYSRINGLINNERFPNICEIEHGDENLPPELRRLFITSRADMEGDVYFNYIKNKAFEKKKVKMLYQTTPFLDSKDNFIKMLPPTISATDSFSSMSVTAIEERIGGNNIGDSKNNTKWLNEGAAKAQLVGQLPNLAANYGMYFILTVHTSDNFDELQGQYAPKKPRLVYAKKGLKLSGSVAALEKFANVIYEIQTIKPLDQQTGGVRYPLIESDRSQDCTDLLEIKLCVIRNKHGNSGAILPLVLSQREGYLPHLSQFHYIKDNDSHKNFGIEGNDRFYNLTLCPDVKLQRTTVREVIDGDYKVRRALEITSQLLQIKMTWNDLPGDLMCTPKELYEDIKTKGYKWEEILETREWWKFNESNPDYPFQTDCDRNYLSTMDLLKMRKGIYHPYWIK